MNPFFAAVVLLLLASVLFLLPMLPAILELRLKRDAQPLNVIQQYAGDIRHFAHGFRDYIQHLGTSLEACAATGKTFTAMLPNGDKCLLLGRSDFEKLISAWSKGSALPFVLVLSRDSEIPGHLTFLKEIYAVGGLLGGEGASYRAILGERNVHLHRGSKVMRWAHAVGGFQAGPDCDLYGRISSEAEIILQSGCIFQRLNAPRIAVGRGTAVVHEPQPSPPADSILQVSSPVSADRRLFDDDLEIRPGEVFRGDVVTRGTLRIGSAARVLGSVKSNQHMVVEADALVEGSLISAGKMEIGPGCRIHGPVLAEHEMTIASGTVCGEFETPTTVSAPHIEVEEGVLVFGSLWARELGRVVPGK